MLEAPALCPAGEGGSGVATGAMRKIRRRVQREKAAPVSRPAKLRYHIQREEAPTSRQAGGEALGSRPARGCSGATQEEAPASRPAYLRKEAPAS